MGASSKVPWAAGFTTYEWQLVGCPFLGLPLTYRLRNRVVSSGDPNAVEERTLSALRAYRHKTPGPLTTPLAAKRYCEENAGPARFTRARTGIHLPACESSGRFSLG